VRRPARTRRLSIAAIVSLLAVCPYIRSFWTYDGFDFRSGGEIELDRGCFLYEQAGVKHIWGAYLGNNYRDSIWGFAIGNPVAIDPVTLGNISFFRIRIPLWPVILLLLIAPLRWLIARPPNAPAFPVIVDAKQPK